MSSSKVYHLSELATIFGGVLLPTSWIVRVSVGVQRPYTETVEFVATILLVFGFMVVYGFQHEETGVLGFFGFLQVIVRSRWSVKSVT